MPELPELEVISKFLTEKICGKKISDINIINSICIRTGKDEFKKDLVNKRIDEIKRIGKTLLFSVKDYYIIFNLMLTGRLQYLKKNEKLLKKTLFYLEFENNFQLRYQDRKRMGKVYHFNSIPEGFFSNAPDILEISESNFVNRFKRFSRSRLKDILINQKFVQGIGNAYSDEILFKSKFHPLRFGKELTVDEISLLYRNSKKVLLDAIKIISRDFNGKIEEENREFMKVHGKKEQPCPTCGKTISSITANRRITNFCRNCQK